MKLPLQKERIPLKQIILYGFLPSFLKIFIYKLKGFKIGSKVRIGFGSIIIAKDVVIKNNVQIGFLSIIQARKIEIDEYTSIASFCYFDTEYLKIGKDTRIREQVKVGVLKTPESKLIIGDRCLINQSVLLNTTKPIIIGNDSAIGGHSFLFTHSSWLSQLEGFPVKFEPIKIGDYVWISWKTFITPGVEIGDYSLVQPNAVVSKNVPANSIFTNAQNRIIPNTFYPSVSLEKKKQLVRQIVNDFIEYMRYEGLEVYTENSGMSCSIDHHNYRIILQESETVEMSPAYNNILLAFQDSENIIVGLRNKDMLMDFNNKNRYGTNLLGEELIKFFSRYGVRFSRKT